VVPPDTPFGNLCSRERVSENKVLRKMAVFWVVEPCSLEGFLTCGLLIALMMEAASTSETSVNFYQITRHNNPEDSHLHTRRRENLKSHKVLRRIFGRTTEGVTRK
jgi:hypothetical protein